MATSENDAKLFLLILTFFAAWSGFVGFINMAHAGTITLDGMGRMTSGSIEGQTIPNIVMSSVPGINEPVTEQDYTQGPGVGWDANYTKVKGGFALGPLWTQINGYGYVCNNTPLLGGFSKLVVAGIMPQNNIYSVTYHIVPNGEDFYTLVYEADPQTLGIILHYSPEGVAVNLGGFGGSDGMTGYTMVPYPNAHLATEIKVDFDSFHNSENVTVDGNFLGTFENGYEPYAGLPNTVYGGVFTEHTGLVVEKITAQLQTGRHASGDWIQGFEDFLTGIWNAVFAFGSIIAAITGLADQSVVPIGVWAIIGVPSIVTLVYLYLKLARG